MQTEKTFDIYYVPGEGKGSVAMQETYCDMTVHGWVKLETRTFTVNIDIESDAAVKKLLDGLEKAKAIVRAEAGVRVNMLEGQIARLLCLDYVPAADADAPVLKTVGGDDDF